LCIKRKEKISGVFHRSLFINMNGVLLVKAIVMDQFHHMQKKSKKKTGENNQKIIHFRCLSLVVFDKNK